MALLDFMKPIWPWIGTTLLQEQMEKNKGGMSMAPVAPVAPVAPQEKKNSGINLKKVFTTAKDIASLDPTKVIPAGMDIAKYVATPAIQSIKENLPEAPLMSTAPKTSVNPFRVPNIKKQTPAPAPSAPAPAPASTPAPMAEEPMITDTISTATTTSTTTEPAPVSSTPMEVTAPKVKDTTQYKDAMGRPLTGIALSRARKEAEARRKAEGVNLLDSKQLLNATDEEIALAKQREVNALNAADKAALETDKAKSELTASTNLDLFKKAFTGMENAVQSDLNKFKADSERMSNEYENARKMRVSWAVRARMASAGIDISKIPQEQLIALSDEIGVAAFNDIYTNKKNTIDAINQKQELATSKLNDLRNKGLIAEQEYNTTMNSINAAFNKSKNDVQRAYVNDIFGIGDKYKTAKEAKSGAAVNTIETFLRNIPSEQAGAFRSRYSSLINSGLSPAEITRRITTDPQYIAWSEYLAKQQTAAAWAKAQMENLVKQSQINKNLASGTRSTSGGTKSKATSDKIYNAAILEWVPGINTRESFEALEKTNPVKFEAIKKRLEKPEVPMIQPDNV